ncbi:hypothetical protein C1645_738919 [Glomus cerebriforme]|uniref:Uncharacterized protein n=1 Tax=Glomus cerebriforme TaxID=658196 RepID=A0A397SZ29_9GLOM|nr:hypothetical protein C1645_738919 [Glomus cerebriforme]
MNKKYLLCIFTILITITNLSYAFPAYSKPMSKRATLVPMSGIFKISSKVGTSNTTELSVDDINNLNAIKPLDIVKRKRLQDDTGAFDYDLDIPRDNYPVNVFGYPIDGDMNCPRVGQHLYIQKKVLSEEEFAGITVQKISEGLEFQFFKEEKLEKKLLILAKDFKEVTCIRSTQLVSNNKDHAPFALMERIGQPDEVYRRIDCTLVITEKIEKTTCENCEKLRKTLQKIQQRILNRINSIKVTHASKEIFIEKVNQQRKTIKKQNKIIIDLKDHLKEKIEREEEVSDEIANIAHIVSKSKNIDTSTLHPIFQELIHIQTGKPNGTRYHPI